jgi:hypothetical protein
MKKSLALLILPLLAACEPNQGSIIMTGTCSDKVDSAGCTIDCGNANGFHRARGFVDLQITGNTFVEAFGFKNAMPPNVAGGPADPLKDGAGQPMRANTNDVEIQQLELSYQMSGDLLKAVKSIPDQVVDLTLVAPAGGGQNSLIAPLITQKAGEKLSNSSADLSTPKEVLVTVRLVGKLKDGTIIRSDTMAYPVDVCVGCLPAAPSCGDASCADPTKIKVTYCHGYGQSGSCGCN